MQVKLNKHGVDIMRESRMLDTRCIPIRLRDEQGQLGTFVPDLTKPEEGKSFRVISFPLRTNPNRLLCFDVVDLVAYVVMYARTKLGLSDAESLNEVLATKRVIGLIPNPLSTSEDAMRSVRKRETRIADSSAIKMGRSATGAVYIPKVDVDYERFFTSAQLEHLRTWYHSY